MSFPILICSNCDKEKDDDNFLLLKFEEENNFNKNKKRYSDFNSFSDNNNSTNNYLEIIEYPYSLNNNQDDDNNYNNIPKQLYQPNLTENVKRKKEIIDYDDDLKDIKPPKLFGKSYIEKKEENQQNQTEHENVIENYQINENKNITKENLEDHQKMNSNISESLINNDNSMMNNKILLTNYYINSQNNKNKQNISEKEYIKNDSKNMNDINNNNIQNNKILAIKVEYPCPDTNSFYLNNNDKNLLKNINIESIERQKLDEKNEKGIAEKNLFLNKIQKKAKKNFDKKILFTKPKTKALSSHGVNIDRIKSNLEKDKNNKNIKGKKEMENTIIKKRKKLTFNSLSNFDNKFNIRLKNSNDDVSNFFNFTEKYQIRKSNNILLKNILDKKINANNQNKFKTFTSNKKKQCNSFMTKLANKTSFLSSKTYSNPFINTYVDKNTKCNFYLINKYYKI